MAERTEYAVLRFLDQNGYCHVVNDFVKGSSFMQYVKAEAVITKRMFFFWMTELAYQMEQYYKCEEGRAYGYVNPYAVIVTEEQEILLLDTADQGNEEIVQRMQKKKVRALFVRREYVLSQKMRTEDDWYGFGKLIQFMTDRCCISERMTVKEERAVRRIAEKCISGKYEGVRGWREVKKELRRLKNMEEGRVEKSGKRREKSEVQRMLLGAAAIVAALAAVITMMQGREHIGKADSTDTVLAEELQGGEEEEDSLEELASGKELNEIQEKSGRVSLEMGLLYFVELEDFEKSYEYLKLSLIHI